MSDAQQVAARIMEHERTQAMRLPRWAKDKRLARPYNWLTEAFERLLIYAEGDEYRREGMRDTPERASRAWAELTEGYQMEWDAKAFPAEGRGLIVMDAIPFHSLCEHHCLPFFGTVHFAYIPGETILGFSKFARLVTVYSRRLQVQERLASQMMDAIQEKLHPEGAMVIVRAQHLCMSMRGAQSLGQTAVTSEVTGAFSDNAESRAEAMGLMGL